MMRLYLATLPFVLLLLTSCERDQRRACSPPLSSWGDPHDFSGLLPPVVRVSLNQAGGAYWNGAKVSSRLLVQRFTAVRTMRPPQPIVFLETEMGAPCERVDAIRAEMERILHCSEERGVCAEGIMTVWEHTPSPPETPPS